MKSLLFVLNDSRFFLTHRLPIALAAKAVGFDVHVATPRDESSSVVERHGISFHAIDLFRGSLNPWREAKTVISLYRLYRRVRPDIVHHVTIKPVLYGGIAARLAKVPVVVAAIAGRGYVFTARDIKASILRPIIRLLYRLALMHRDCRVIFQNPDDLDSFLRLRLLERDKTVLIRGSGVDTQIFCPMPEPVGDPVILLACRMLWDKGVGVFVEAARQIKQSGCRVRFILVGDSDPENPKAISCEQLDSWRAEGVVEWWKLRDDMPSVFEQATIACLPSYSEGVPKFLLEAAACGKPIVASKIPGCSEVVRHEENGLLVNVGDAKGLGKAIIRLLDDPELRRRMGARGREIAVEEFAVEGVIAKTLALYGSPAA